MKNGTNIDDGEQTKRKDGVNDRGDCGNGSGDQVHVDNFDNYE